MTDGDVSRETSAGRAGLPAPPPAARELFGTRLPEVEHYARLLAGEATVRGLIGPREIPRLWERHLINSALVADLVPRGATVCDLGSGAGLPGLVLALRRPDLEVCLVEPLLRRTRFLTEAVAVLGLTSVEVVRARAEDLHGRRTFEVVTARAVAPLDRLVWWGLPLVQAGGVLLAMKGSAAPAEVEAAGSAITGAGGRFAGIDELGAGLVDPPVRVVRVDKVRGEP